MSRRARRPTPLALAVSIVATVAAWAALAPLPAPAIPRDEASSPGPPRDGTLGARIAGVLPLSAPAGTAPVRLRLAPGELPRGATPSLAAGGRKVTAEVRVLARHPDGSAALVELAGLRLPPGSGHLLEVHGLHLADPVALIPRSAGAAPGNVPSGAEPVAATTDLAGLVSGTVWKGEVKREGSSPPPWWSAVDARLSPEVDPAPAAQLDFVEAAYAEKGRPREAVRLNAAVLDRLPEPRSPEAERTWLRGAYEVAHLYEGALQDGPRALAWYLRCSEAGLGDPAEARQNAIAAGFGAARAVEALGERPAALALYRLLARDLILAPDPYGDLVLPEVFLRIGDASKAAGDTGAAAAAYRATMAAAARLPATAPSSARAPGSAARAALRLLSARDLDFGRVPDGTFTGEAFGYNAPVGVRMTFREGRCTALHVTALGDKRPLDAYRLVPERILDRQGLAVDAVTGATVTSRAVVSAATEAVFQAVRPPAPRAKSPAASGHGTRWSPEGARRDD